MWTEEQARDTLELLDNDLDLADSLRLRHDGDAPDEASLGYLQHHGRLAKRFKFDRWHVVEEEFCTAYFA